MRDASPNLNFRNTKDYNSAKKLFSLKMYYIFKEVYIFKVVFIVKALSGLNVTLALHAEMLSMI